jgi:putative tryptophan/tyrosine transport system substrate-binding protein
MTRRTVGLLVTLALGLLVALLPAEAQRAPYVYRIGVLSATAPTPALLRRHEAFRRGLRDLGYMEGQNIALERRYAEGRFARLPNLAVELVRLNVDVFVASGSEAVAAVKHATQTIPSVMTHVGALYSAGLSRIWRSQVGTSQACRRRVTTLSGNSWSCSGKPCPSCRAWPSSGIRPSPHTRPS